MSRICLTCFAILFSHMPLSAMADNGLVQITSQYAMRWAGLEIARLSTGLLRQTSEYRVDYNAETAGILAWFFDLKSNGFSAGQLDGDVAKSDVFQGQSRWSDGGSDWRLEFDPTGTIEKLDVSAEDLAKREPVPEDLQRGPDPIALLLSAMHQAEEGAKLRGQSFDGKRAVAAELNCQDSERVSLPILDDQELQSDSLLCTIDGELLAGGLIEYRDERLRPDDTPPARVWLSPDIVANAYWPIQIEAETRFGTVTLRLTDIDGPQLSMLSE